MVAKLSDKIVSIDFDDDDRDYIAFSEFLEEHTERKKNFFANQLEENGEKLLTEINETKERQEPEKRKLIKYILKYESIHYSFNELMETDIADIRIIYSRTKEEHQSFLKKLFKFLFNL